MEVLHIELPDEGGEVAMAEVDGQDYFFKVFHIQDDKVGAFLIQSYHSEVDAVLQDWIEKVLEIKMRWLFPFSIGFLRWIGCG